MDWQFTCLLLWKNNNFEYDTIAFIDNDSKTYCSDNRGTRNNFNKFHSNFSLTSLIVVKSEFLEDFTSVLRSVFHSVHTGSLFRSRRVEESIVNRGGHVQFEEIILGVFQFGFNGFVTSNILELTQESSSGEQLLVSENLGNSILELVVY